MADTNDARGSDRELRTNTRWTTALVALWVLTLAAGGAYAAYQYQRLTDPETLAGIVEDRVAANYGRIEKTLIRKAKDVAPELAEALSDQAVATLPEARERIEAVLEKYYKVGLKEGTEFSADQFRDLVRRYKDEIRQGFAELKEVPDETVDFVKELEEKLDSALGTEIRDQAKAVLSWHRRLNEKLERLTDDGAALSPAELMERRMLRLLKAIQVRELGAPTAG